MSAPGFLSSVLRVFALTWPSLAWGRRTRWLLPVLAWPMLLPLLTRFSGAGATEWKSAAGGLYLDVLLALAALFQASRLVREEVEGRTIVYLLARPASRPAIIAGQFAAYLATTLAIVWPSIVVGFFLVGPPGGTEVLLRALAVSAGVLVIYGALFTLAGLLLRKPMVVSLVGLLFATVLAHAPGRLPLVSPTTYLHALAGEGAPPELTTLAAVGVLAAVTLLSLGTAMVVFRYGEYVPEP